MRHLLFLLVIGVLRYALASCDYSTFFSTEPSIPAPGQCQGPMDRTLSFRSELQQLGACGLTAVEYKPDGDDNTPSLCGACEPGLTWIEDDVCSINHWCDDGGSCVHVDLHPLLGAVCPYEQGTHTSVGWCGPGLRCVQHVCIECEEGSRVARAGLVCLNGKYIRSVDLSNLASDPMNVILLIIALLLAVLVMLVCVFLCLMCGRSQSMKESIQQEVELQTLRYTTTTTRSAPQPSPIASEELLSTMPALRGVSVVPHDCTMTCPEADDDRQSSSPIDLMCERRPPTGPIGA